MKTRLLDKLMGKQADPAADGADPAWDDPFATLRRKWSEVPLDSSRVSTPGLLKLSDADLLTQWTKWRDEVVVGHEGFRRRGWLKALYQPLLTGARFMDFGSGMGFDGLTFAPFCASVTFVDVAPTNLELIGRVARAMGFANVTCVLLESYDSFAKLGEGYDVIWANGSLHHAPMRVIKKELSLLTPRLKVGGRWIQLTYPKVRWERAGSPPFSLWGTMTDGAATPWAEWYDEEKLLAALSPARFEVVMSFNFWHDDFNWFDLAKRG